MRARRSDARAHRENLGLQQLSGSGVVSLISLIDQADHGRRVEICCSLLLGKALNSAHKWSDHG